MSVRLSSNNLRLQRHFYKSLFYIKTYLFPLLTERVDMGRSSGILPTRRFAITLLLIVKTFISIDKINPLNNLLKLYNYIRYNTPTSVFYKLSYESANSNIANSNVTFTITYIPKHPRSFCFPFYKNWTSLKFHFYDFSLSLCDDY